MPLREASGFTLAGVPYALWTFSYGYSLGPPLQSLHLDRSWHMLAPHAPVLLLGMAAVGAGFVLGMIDLAQRGRLLLVCGLLLVPLVLVVILASREVKTFHPRYLIASFPAFIAVLGAGWSRPGWISRISAAVALILAFVALKNLYFDPRYAKEDLRSAAQTILREEQPGDSIVVIYSYRPFQYYFQTKGGGQAPVLRLHKRFLKTSDDLRAHVAEASQGKGRVWLVLSRWWDVAPEERIRSAFEETLAERKRWEYPGVKLTLYEGAAS
jgi:vacuolar-type H+-ATPase subunit I/STV1